MVVAVAGCGGSGAGSTATSSPAPSPLRGAPSGYLLKLDQLPQAGFAVVDAAHDVAAADLAADAEGARRLDVAGFEAASQARYFRSVPELGTSNGPIDVETLAARFGDARGAGEGYRALAGRADALPSASPLSGGSGLGDEEHVSEQRAPAPGGTAVVQVVVVWRSRNLVDRLVVRGRDGGFDLSVVLGLAQRQQGNQR